MLKLEREALQILSRNNLRKTRVRLHVTRALLESERALSASEIEEGAGHIDRITLYRTIRTFEEKGIIHKAIDGSDTPKYALCSDVCTEHEHHDDHVHFHCEMCHTTICLDIPARQQMELPDGFVKASTHVLVKGYCSRCN